MARKTVTITLKITVRRLTEWLVELDAEAARPDQGDGWRLTGQGRVARDLAKQRAEDLRTLIDATTLK